MMKSKKQRYTFRKLMNDLHLWLGVASSLILFIVCLSGTIYTFKSEIQYALEPSRYKIESQQNVLQLTELVQLVQEKVEGKVVGVTISKKETEPYVLSVTKGEEKGRPEQVSVNQYTGEIVGAGKPAGSEFFTSVMKLHRWLLLEDSVGRPIVGIATLIFLFLCISGLVLWLPKKIKGWKSFKPGFKIKFNANWKRINHDLHNTLGFYTLLFVIIMALTGLCWSFDWYREGASKMIGGKIFGGRNEEKPQSDLPQSEAKTITLEQALAIANTELPFEARKTSISFPKGEEGSFEINKNDAKRFNETVTDRVFIDQYSGNIIRKDIFSDKTAGEQLASSIKALHLGDIYGLFSKIIYFIVCLIATSLPITGIFIWLNKRKKSKN